MKQFVEFVITKTGTENEMLVARLGQLPIDSIWEDEQLKFYIDQDLLDERMISEIDRLSADLNFSYTSQTLENRNWNAEWESDFEAVEVEDFVRIRALFHEPESGFQHELVVHPKMAFGTGHHATTWMMVKNMGKFDFKGSQVWDFGTGTGILAILANKLGAAHIEANDIEDIAIENAIENEALNNVQGIQFEIGGIEKTSNGPFDYILANINRNVLLSSMSEMVTRLKDMGTLILSGVLEADKEIMINCLTDHGLTEVVVDQKGEWLCMICHRKVI
jgi:ribosomal protein L11 methyltransferase